eukprot:gene23521-53499_t
MFQHPRSGGWRIRVGDTVLDELHDIADMQPLRLLGERGSTQACDPRNTVRTVWGGVGMPPLPVAGFHQLQGVQGVPQLINSPPGALQSPIGGSGGA